jgi:hypothetical protein
MNLNKKALGVAVAVALLSTSAFAVSPYGNTSQKGSLLVFPLIDTSDGKDTLIRITNDYSRAVSLKCYYLATDASDYKKKYRGDFTIELSKTHPQAFWAKSGRSEGSTRYGLNLRPFTKLVPAGPDGASGIFDPVKVNKGELKCWAMDAEFINAVRHNHLVGTATIVDYKAGSATEYNAWSFQGLPLDGPNGATLSAATPGKLVLDGTSGNYDKVPKFAVGMFTPWGSKLDNEQITDLQISGGENWAKLYLASGTQDFSQSAKPIITKYAFTFFNQDENQLTMEHTCADSWVERDLSVFYSASAEAVGTYSAYYRVESNADDYVCPGSVVVGMMGVQVQGVQTGQHGGVDDNGQRFVRAVATQGRGSTEGRITFNNPPSGGGGPPNLN